MRTLLRTLILGALVAAPLACDRPDPARDAASDPAAPPGDGVYPVEIEPGIAVAIRKTGSREYMFYGGTDRADSLRLSVEDGHNMLFGPVEVPVGNGRFRVDFIIEQTDRDHIFFYITDIAGTRLAVVPVDTARELTTAGPAALLPEPPELGALPMGDRRTRVTAQGLESPHFRVRWPQVSEGATSLQLQGETDLSLFRAEVRRRETVLVAQQPRVVGSPGEWNTFATELRVPGGIREGDAIVIATGEAPPVEELVFQPIRN